MTISYISQAIKHGQAPGKMQSRSKKDKLIGFLRHRGFVPTSACFIERSTTDNNRKSLLDRAVRLLR